MHDMKTNASSNNNGELTINVKSQDNSIICFKLKQSTALKKLMDSYCKRHGYRLGSVRFIYEGDVIKESDTPASLEIDDGEEIDAMVEQHGGGAILIE